MKGSGFDLSENSMKNNKTETERANRKKSEAVSGKTKKRIAAAAACGMLAAVGAGASAAYLTDGESVTNTFTVGKVSIDLTEPGYTPENEVPRVPNQEIPKDPTVVNTGNNDEIVFVSFDIPMNTVKTAEYDGTVQKEAVNQELFDFRTESGTYSSVNDGWILLGTPEEIDEDNNGVSDYKTYVYGYHQVVKAAAEGKEAVGVPGEDDYQAAVEAAEATQVPPIFDYIRLANLVEGQLEKEKLRVPVRAYAIQADFLQSADNSEGNHNIETEGMMDEATLSQIFAVFKNQNQTEDPKTGALAPWKGIHAEEGKQAGMGNELDLIGNPKQQ